MREFSGKKIETFRCTGDKFCYWYSIFSPLFSPEINSVVVSLCQKQNRSAKGNIKFLLVIGACWISSRGGKNHIRSSASSVSTSISTKQSHVDQKSLEDLPTWHPSNNTANHTRWCIRPYTTRLEQSCDALYSVGTNHLHSPHNSTDTVHQRTYKILKVVCEFSTNCGLVHHGVWERPILVAQLKEQGGRHQLKEQGGRHQLKEQGGRHQLKEQGGRHQASSCPLKEQGGRHQASSCPLSILSRRFKTPSSLKFKDYQLHHIINDDLLKEDLDGSNTVTVLNSDSSSEKCNFQYFGTRREMLQIFLSASKGRPIVFTGDSMMRNFYFRVISILQGRAIFIDPKLHMDMEYILGERGDLLFLHKNAATMDWRGWKLWEKIDYYANWTSPSNKKSQLGRKEEVIGKVLLTFHFIWDPFMEQPRLNALRHLNPRVHIAGYNHWWNYVNASRILHPVLSSYKDILLKKNNDRIIIFNLCTLARNNEGHPPSSKNFVDKLELQAGHDPNKAIKERNDLVAKAAAEINREVLFPAKVGNKREVQSNGSATPEEGKGKQRRRFLLMDLESFASAGKFHYIDRVHFTCMYDPMDTCAYYWFPRKKELPFSMVRWWMVEVPRCNCCPLPHFCMDPLHTLGVHYLLHMLRPYT